MNKIQPEEVKRDSLGFWSHSRMPKTSENAKLGELDGWCYDHDIILIKRSMESEFETDDLYRDCHLWEPKITPERGEFLLSVHDTDNGPVSWVACRRPTP